MPMVSQAQNRFMHWAQQHPKESGVSPAVSGEFVNAAHGQDIKHLPERVAKKAQGGVVYPRDTKW